MPDLREHFQAADQIPVADLVDAVHERLAVSETGDVRTLRPIAQLESRSPRRGGAKRILTIAAAFVIASVSIAVAVLAFGPMGARQPAAGPVLASISVGNWSDIAGGDGAIWVVTEEGSLLRIDASTDKVAGEIALGGVSQERTLAVDDDAVWVANRDSGQVQRIDRATNRVDATIDVGGSLMSIASGSGAVWVSRYADHHWGVVRVDPATNNLSTTIPLDVDPDSISIVAADGAVWVGTQSTVDRIDPATNEVSRVYEGRFGSGMAGFTVADGALWSSECDEWGGPNYESRPDYVSHLYESHPMCEYGIRRIDTSSGENSIVPIGAPHPERSPNGIRTLADMSPSLVGVDGHVAWLVRYDLEGMELGTEPPCGWCVTESSRVVNSRLVGIDVTTGRILASQSLDELLPPDGVLVTGVLGELQEGDLWMLTATGSLLRVDIGVIS